MKLRVKIVRRLIKGWVRLGAGGRGSGRRKGVGEASGIGEQDLYKNLHGPSWGWVWGGGERRAYGRGGGKVGIIEKGEGKGFR